MDNSYPPAPHYSTKNRMKYVRDCTTQSLGGHPYMASFTFLSLLTPHGTSGASSIQDWSDFFFVQINRKFFAQFSGLYIGTVVRNFLIWGQKLIKVKKLWHRARKGSKIQKKLPTSFMDVPPVLLPVSAP